MKEKKNNPIELDPKELTNLSGGQDNEPIWAITENPGETDEPYVAVQEDPSQWNSNNQKSGPSWQIAVPD